MNCEYLYFTIMIEDDFVGSEQGSISLLCWSEQGSIPFDVI